MRSSLAPFAIVVAALAGCGGNATGVERGGTGVEPSSGSASGNGSSTGNGSVDPTNAGSVGSSGGTTTTGGYVPQTCDQNAPCPSGQLCSTQADRGQYAPGYCVLTCTLPEGVNVGKASCPGSAFCVRVGQSSVVGACVLPCGTDLDCPVLAGLEASCVSIDAGGPHFCIWSTPATPGGR